MPEVGLEPTRGFPHRLLGPTCLPNFTTRARRHDVNERDRSRCSCRLGSSSHIARFRSKQDASRSAYTQARSWIESCLPNTNLWLGWRPDVTRVPTHPRRPSSERPSHEASRCDRGSPIRTALETICSSSPTDGMCPLARPCRWCCRRGQEGHGRRARGGLLAPGSPLTSGSSAESSPRLRATERGRHP